jgi:hypothetical protein
MIDRETPVVVIAPKRADKEVSMAKPTETRHSLACFARGPFYFVLAVVVVATVICRILRVDILSNPFLYVGIPLITGFVAAIFQHLSGNSKHSQKKT